MDNIVVVIVSYNGEKWIRNCLGSLVSGTVPVKSIVIDNGSTDATTSIIEKEFPETRLIKSEKNLGFGQANNKGIQWALGQGADYVLLLNQDAWVETGTIEALVSTAKKYPSFGVVSPMHVNADHSELDYNFSSFITPDHCPGLYSDVYLNKTGEVYEADFVNAACWLLSKACIDKIGLFDPLFYHYGEDRNYCQRVKYHGFKVGVCPGTRIVHDRQGRKGVVSGFDGLEERKRLLLIKFADVRQKSMSGLDKYILKCLLMIPLSLLSLRVGVFKNYLSYFGFLLRRRGKIRNSYEVNREP